jgi:mono/diheme cytochrome c family protein
MHRARLGAAFVAVLVSTGAMAQERSPEEKLYLQYCGSCHQPNGKGIPGFFPPLAGNESVTSDDAEEIQEFLRKIIFGFHGALVVDDKVYVGTMPPIGIWGRVNDSEILALVNYQRNAWGNRARPISAQELAQARQALDDEPDKPDKPDKDAKKEP